MKASERRQYKTMAQSAPFTILRCPECGAQRLSYPCKNCGSGVSSEEVEVVPATEVNRLREEYKRIAWCHLGPGGTGCGACRDRADALGLAPTAAKAGQGKTT